jgi:hypothetical protein
LRQADNSTFMGNRDIGNFLGKGDAEIGQKRRGLNTATGWFMGINSVLPAEMPKNGKTSMNAP